MNNVVIFWSSHILIILAFTFHRMGPSFDRSRFGAPLSLLGVSCLLFLTDGLGIPESELKLSIIEFFFWAIPFISGSIVILGSAPIYGRRNKLGMSIGWLLILVAWAMIFSQSQRLYLWDLTTGIWISIGLVIGLIFFFIAISLSERFSGIINQSEPLSQSERNLVELS